MFPHFFFLCVLLFVPTYHFSFFHSPFLFCIRTTIYCSLYIFFFYIYLCLSSLYAAIFLISSLTFFNFVFLFLSTPPDPRPPSTPLYFSYSNLLTLHLCLILYCWISIQSFHNLNQISKRVKRNCELICINYSSAKFLKLSKWLGG